MSGALQSLAEIAKQARIAESLATTSEARQVAIEIRLAANGAIAAERAQAGLAVAPAARAEKHEHYRRID